VFVGEEVVVDQRDGGPPGHGQSRVRIVTVETTEKIDRKPRPAPVVPARAMHPAAPVFGSLYAYISSGTPSRSPD
jgi:hypothetical protein